MKTDLNALACIKKEFKATYTAIKKLKWYSLADISKKYPLEAVTDDEPTAQTLFNNFVYPCTYSDQIKLGANISSILVASNIRASVEDYYTLKPIQKKYFNYDEAFAAILTDEDTQALVVEDNELAYLMIAKVVTNPLTYKTVANMFDKVCLQDYSDLSREDLLKVQDELMKDYNANIRPYLHKALSVLGETETYDDTHCLISEEAKQNVLMRNMLVTLESRL